MVARALVERDHCIRRIDLEQFSGSSRLSKTVPTAMIREPWISAQVDAFERFRGLTISRAQAVEVAFFEEGADGLPVFEHPALPFLQLMYLDLETTSGTCLRVSVYQSDSNFGLCVRPVDEPATEFSGIYRKTELHELAGQLIDQVHVVLDDLGDITEVRLDRSARPAITLIAGEVDETWSGAIVHRQDESVLLFWRPEDLAKVVFETEISIG